MSAFWLNASENLIVVVAQYLDPFARTFNEPAWIYVWEENEWKRSTRSEESIKELVAEIRSLNNFIETVNEL